MAAVCGRASSRIHGAFHARLGRFHAAVGVAGAGVLARHGYIKKFIDFAGPAVYVVMFILAGYMVWRAGWQNIGINLGASNITGSKWCR